MFLILTSLSVISPGIPHILLSYRGPTLYVTSKTQCLINNDIASNSSKNKKAKELGIPILTEEDFMAKYL